MNFDQIASNLLRNVEDDLGSQGMTELVLESYSETAQNLKIEDRAEFLKQMKGLLKMFIDTKPKYAMLLDSFYEIWTSANNCKGDDFIECVQKEIERQIQKINEDSKNIMVNGQAIIDDGDTLLVYNTSKTALKVLSEAKKRGKKFKVILAEQNEGKTSSIIDYLVSHKIAFSTVPAYMVSHMTEHVTKAMFGAVTYKNTNDFVMNTGSAGLVSLMREHKIKTYMFMATSKMALWESKPHESAFKTTNDKGCSRIKYKKISFSHDRVSVDNFDLVITESGRFTSKQFDRLYQEKFAKRTTSRASVLS
jgi:translation initiation factor 2B subunit (eIF-2B alpha/beta/delta family)